MTRRLPFLSVFGALLFGLLNGCQPYIQGPSEPLPTYVQEEQSLDKEELVPKEEEMEEGGVPLPAEIRAVVFRPKTGSAIEKTLEILETRPNLRLTLVLPEILAEEENKENLDRFKLLVSSGQIETVLTLAKEPNLALVSNFTELVPEARNWNFEIKWEEDVLSHLASGIAAHKKRWALLPSGLLPPYFALTPDIMRGIKRFRMAWVIGRPQTPSGWRFYGPTGLFIPEPQLKPTDASEGSPSWGLALADWALSQKASFVDGELWRTSRAEEEFLTTLASQAKNQNIGLILMSELTAGREIKEDLPRESDPFQSDYSDWAQTERQRQAWGALAEARDVLELYKNSGRANLRRLDAAQEELLSAQSGPFLFALGQSLVPLTNNQQNFIATLSNVYRLCGVGVPEDINRTFSKRKTNGTRTPSSKSGPFFQREENSLVWNDPSGDDNGFGEYTYPVGGYKSGVFDLTRFRVSWTESTIRLTAVVRADIQPEKTPALPLVDIYIDVNRVANAGSGATLPGRGAVRVDRDAAWEYAVTMGVGGAALYQSVIGADPRKILDLKTVHNDQYHSISVSIPRNLLRGDPDQWRLSVGISGSEQIRSAQKLTPLPVNPNASEKAFGGGIPGRHSPAYIDIIARDDQEQKQALNPVQTGREGILPFLEGE